MNDEKMFNQICIKRVTKQDAQFLFELMNNNEIVSALNETSTAYDAWDNAISEWLNDEDEENFIIFNSNMPIGWLGINSLKSADKKVYIKIIALLPEYQSKGIGEYAINYIKNHLKNRGYGCLCLYTDKNNFQAQNCYKKCGFTVKEKVKQKMSNGKNVNRYKMECDML